jgi:D-alanine-D-alanine ligase
MHASRLFAHHTHHDEARRPRVAVVFGGTSSEHAVSCLTAAGVVGAIDRERYEVIGLGITRTGRWRVLPPDVVAGMTVQEGRLPEVEEVDEEAVLIRSTDGTEVAVRNATGLTTAAHIDVAFPVLHGPFGEDGTIQGLFEMTGTRYVGSGVLSSAVGMDKHYMKLLLAASSLPVGPYVSITPGEWAHDPSACLDAVAALHFPVFVKPARGGSSLGISRVESLDGVSAAVDEAQRYDPKVIVEEGFVDCRELECGVLEDLHGGPPSASPVAEIRVQTESGFYDFDAKYLPEEQVQLDVPADVVPEVAKQVRELAIHTFNALGAEGLARVDVFVTREHRVVINEINTMPGFTPHSMFPRMWAAAGVDYPTLVDRLLRLALARPVGLR